MHTKWNTILDVSKWCAKMKAKLCIRTLDVFIGRSSWRFCAALISHFIVIMVIQLSVSCLWVVCHYVEFGRLIICAFLHFLMRDYNKLFKVFRVGFVFSSSCSSLARMFRKRKRQTQSSTFLHRDASECEQYSNWFGNTRPVENEPFNIGVEPSNALFHFPNAAK